MHTNQNDEHFEEDLSSNSDSNSDFLNFLIFIVSLSIVSIVIYFLTDRNFSNNIKMDSYTLFENQNIEKLYSNENNLYIENGPKGGVVDSIEVKIFNFKENDLIDKFSIQTIYKTCGRYRYFKNKWYISNIYKNSCSEKDALNDINLLVKEVDSYINKKIEIENSWKTK